MYRQFELHADGGFRLVCWLENDRRLTIGRRLTIKGPDVDPKREWFVYQRFDTVQPKPPEKRWKVGGLT